MPGRFAMRHEVKKRKEISRKILNMFNDQI